jgi:hypothetical protein
MLNSSGTAAPIGASGALLLCSILSSTCQRIQALASSYGFLESIVDSIGSSRQQERVFYTNLANFTKTA